MSQKRYVKIVNPPAGWSHVTYERAKRLVRREKARFDSVGRLVLLYDDATLQRMKKGGGLTALKVAAFCGLDAFPGRAVLPPSAAVLDALRPLRPPMRPAR